MTTKPSARNVPKVYLIDDDPVVTFLLVDLTESVNLPYVVFENAVKFLEQNLEGLEGCIVSDLRMPGMSGGAAGRVAPARRQPADDLRFRLR